MAIRLEKGQNAKLDQDLNVFHVGLGWDVNEGASQYDFDLDVSAFMINNQKNCYLTTIWYFTTPR